MLRTEAGYLDAVRTLLRHGSRDELEELLDAAMIYIPASDADNFARRREQLRTLLIRADANGDQRLSAYEIDREIRTVLAFAAANEAQQRLGTTPEPAPVPETDTATVDYLNNLIGVSLSGGALFAFVFASAEVGFVGIAVTALVMLALSKGVRAKVCRCTRLTLVRAKRNCNSLRSKARTSLMSFKLLRTNSRRVHPGLA